MANIATRPRFQRVLTSEEIQQVEISYGRTHGVHRRLMQHVLAKNSRELLALVRRLAADDQGTQALSATLEGIQAYAQHLTYALELTQCAEARLLSCIHFLLSADQAKPARTKGPV